jgi:hypothetical protein
MGITGLPVLSRASLRQVVKRPDSRRAARRIACWVRARRSMAKSSWELTGW